MHIVDGAVTDGVPDEVRSTVVLVAQPPGKVYVMRPVPVPPTIPVAAPTERPEEEVLQAPPETASLSVSDPPAHPTAVPPISDGTGMAETVTVAIPQAVV